MSHFEREFQPEIVIPKGSVPLAAGEITAELDGGVMELSEDVRYGLLGFISNGENSQELYEVLQSELRRNPNSAILRIVKDPETKQVVRVPIGLGEARGVLDIGTPLDPTALDLVSLERRTLRISSDLAPAGTQIGDKVGIWVDPNLYHMHAEAVETSLVVAHMAVTAIVKLP